MIKNDEVKVKLNFKKQLSHIEDKKNKLRWTVN